MRREVSVNIIKTVLSILLAFLSVCNAAENEIQWDAVKDFFKSHTSEHLVYIDKSSFRVFVVSRERDILFEAPVSIGQNPDLLPKIHQGDKRTPEGLYKVTEVMRRDMPEDSNAYKKLKRMNSVFFSKAEGYHKWGKPQQDLGTNSFGFGFFRLNYPNANDKRRYIDALNKGLIPKTPDGQYRSFGSGIGIHGTNDPDSLGHPASNGCIRVQNEELVILADYLVLGQFVLIAP